MNDTTQEFLPIGTTFLGKYVIEQELDRDEVSTTYLASDPPSGQFVAIRLAHPHHTECYRRFRIASTALKRFNHPSVLRLFEYEAHAFRAYMVTEHLHFRTLIDLIEERRQLEPAFLAQIFALVCDALEHVHSQRVVTCSVAPEHIAIVSNTDGGASVKLFHFEWATLYDEGGKRLFYDPDAPPDMFRIYGDPNYMSPEYMMDKHIDWRSDLYSLGCTLFTALTGTPLFSGDDIMELFQKQTSEEPTRLSDRRPDLEFRPALEEVLQRALRKDPAERFESMQDFKEALVTACSD